MKVLIAILVILLAASVVGETDGSSEDTPKNFLLSANPFILVIAGAIIFFASNLAKIVGMILMAIGLINLVMLLL
jgi:hypothetical protein